MAKKYDEDGRPIHLPDYIIGQNLENLSLEDLDSQIMVLKEEIVRLESAKKDKAGSIEAAEAFFKHCSMESVIRK